jgi:hypothetical protein
MEEPTAVFALFILIFWGLSLAGLIAFGIFAGREEGTPKAKAIIWSAIVVACLMALLWGGFMVGAMIAASFYVADKKNRSRLWAASAFLVGPITLLVLVLLPKLQPEGALSLNTP